jgi:hypothetical protein
MIANDGATKFFKLIPTAVIPDRMFSVIFRTLPANPAADKTLVQPKTTDGTNIRFMHTATGNLSYQINAGAVVSLGAITVSTFYRLQVRYTAVTTTTGTSQFKVFTSAANWSTQFGTTVNLTAQNYGALGVSEIDVGIITSTTPGDTTYIDYSITEDGRSTDFPAPPTSSPPVASAGPDQDPLAGDTVTLTAAASTAGTGTISSYAWTCIEFPVGAPSPSISNPAAVSPTVNVAFGGRYRFQVLVTNSSAQTNSAIMTCWVAEQSNTDTDVYSVNAPTYTNEGGAPNQVSAVNDTTNATYILSADGAGGNAQLTFNPVGLGTIDILVDERWFDAPCNRALTLYKSDGTTVIDSLSSYALPAAFNTHTWTISPAGLAVIPLRSDRRALILKLADT